MSGHHCYVFVLPEDTLLSMLEIWLELKGVVRLDSAICNRSMRPSYLEVLGKCPLQSRKYNGYLVDEYIRWRSSRHLKRLDTLVVGEVSESFVENSTYAADILVEVKSLFLKCPGGDNTTRWLELVVPSFQNLSEFHSIGLRFDDIDWIPLLGRNEHLETLSMHFERKNYLLPDSMLYHFRNCQKLKTVKLFNYCCNGVESILANNTNLIYLMLESCNSMTDKTFMLILNLPCIQCIDLCGNTYVTGDGALNITTTTLRLLSLAHFYRLTEDNLLRILAALPNKTIVDVRLDEMERFTDAFEDRCEHMCLQNVYINLRSM